MELIAIQGLPGSGKTTYANEAYRDLTILDDIDRDRDIDVFKWLNTSLKNASSPVVHISIFLLNDKIRKNYEKMLPGHTVSWEFFENDLEACEANLERRDDERMISSEFMKTLHRSYKIPKGAKTHRVWRP